MKGVFKGIEEDISRTRSEHDLLARLNAPLFWLLCSLIHPFPGQEEGDITGFIKDRKRHLPSGFNAPSSPPTNPRPPTSGPKPPATKARARNSSNEKSRNHPEREKKLEAPLPLPAQVIGLCWTLVFAWEIATSHNIELLNVIGVVSMVVMVLMVWIARKYKNARK